MAWAEPWVIEYDKFPYNFNLECLSDFQLGSRSTCRWKIEQHIHDILEDAKHTDSGCMIAGDVEDEDRPTTRLIRYKIAAERPEVVERDAHKHLAWLDRDVIPLLLKLHKGTKYGIMGGVAGHHWTQISPAQNSVQYIFNELKRLTGKPCVYLGRMVSFLDFRFRKKGASGDKSTKVIGLLEHGEGGGQTKAATINKLERAVKSFEADFFIRGHDCQLLGTKSDQLYAKDVRGGLPAIHSRTRVMLNLGAATMGYEMTKDSSSYIEDGMLVPATMGWGRIKFKIKKAWEGEDKNQNPRVYMKLEF